MFDIGWSELVLIGVVALIAIGPKELPGVLRSVGHWMGKIRRTANEFQDQFREAMREADVADLKRQFDEASAKATAGFTSPLESAQKEVEKAFGPEPTAADTSSNIAATDSAAIGPMADQTPSEAPASVVPEPETAGAPMDIKPSDIRPSDIKASDFTPADIAADETKPGRSGAA